MLCALKCNFRRIQVLLTLYIFLFPSHVVWNSTCHNPNGQSERFPTNTWYRKTSEHTNKKYINNLPNKQRNIQIKRLSILLLLAEEPVVLPGLRPRSIAQQVKRTELCCVVVALTACSCENTQVCCCWCVVARLSHSSEQILFISLFLHKHVIYSCCVAPAVLLSACVRVHVHFCLTEQKTTQYFDGEIMKCGLIPVRVPLIAVRKLGDPFHVQWSTSQLAS